MPQNILTNPTVVINNVIVTPKPNSVSYVSGKGTKSVKGVSAGGGNTDIVISQDVESQYGQIKLSLFSTRENYELLRGWQSVELNIGNTISLSEGDFHAGIRHGIVVNDPDIKIGIDESFEVEFHGLPID